MEYDDLATLAIKQLLPHPLLPRTFIKESMRLDNQEGRCYSDWESLFIHLSSIVFLSVMIVSKFGLMNRHSLIFFLLLCFFLKTWSIDGDVIVDILIFVFNFFHVLEFSQSFSFRERLPLD